MFFMKNQINPSYSFKFTVQYVRDNEYRKTYTYELNKQKQFNIYE